MTNFSYWQNQANIRGLVMCMSCFKSKKKSKMYTDEDGRTWDICIPCLTQDHLSMTQGDKE